MYTVNVVEESARTKTPKQAKKCRRGKTQQMARGDLGHYGESAIGKIKNSADGMESSGNKKSLPLKDASQ